MDKSKDEIKKYMSTSLVDLITDQIRTNIYSGKYLPGQRLIVRELSEELGVSHTPIKDALNRLVAEGYVEFLPRKSMVVRRYTNLDFIENVELRLVLEIYSAQDITTAFASDAAGIAELRSICDEMEDAIKEENIDYRAWVELETRFHRGYMSRCSNSKMVELYGSINHNKQTYFAYLRNYAKPLAYDTYTDDIAEHRTIVDALEAGDTYRYISAVTEHVMRTCHKYAVDEDTHRRLDEQKERINRLVKCF